METSSDILIQGITKIIVHQDRYYALDKPLCLISVFDKTGKFLFKIGTKGPRYRRICIYPGFHYQPFFR